ncbi:MAG: hypothetical protein Kow00121_45180 [Elainellaceae cyanobacterium]
MTIDNQLHQAGDSLKCIYLTAPAQIVQFITVEARNGKAVLITVSATGFQSQLILTQFNQALEQAGVISLTLDGQVQFITQRTKQLLNQYSLSQNLNVLQISYDIDSKSKPYS